MNFSKSKYCGFWQCPKMCWLDKYKHDKFKNDNSAQARLSAGTEVGKLARRLFGEFKDVTEEKDGSLDLQAMVEKTERLLEEGAENICEASFSFEGLYCAVDILHRQNGGYAIYEVKSSTKLHEVYLADIAYQKYVLQKCGVNVTGVYLVNINSKYEKCGEIDIHKLFKINDVSKLIAEEEKVVESNLLKAEKLLKETDEPVSEFNKSCKKPHECGYWEYCSKILPKPSVFNLYKLPIEKKVEAYKNGIITFEDLKNSGVNLNAMQKRQIDFALNDKPAYIDKDKIKKFLSKLWYPLYFLDFETLQYVVPEFDGTRPYSQIPFQYSLHYIENEDGEIKHTEFLGISGEDSRREIAERLCADIPQNACVLAYNKKFECGRLKELASLFPDLGEHLLKIRDNVFDLIVPFENGYFYNRAMGGSFSIKSVLPALFPDDPSLNYHNLEGVHNGSEAMNIFPAIKNLPHEDAEKAQRNLLKYCELDTFAMVKLWQELVRCVTEDEVR